MTLRMVNSAELIIIPEGYLALSNIGLKLNFFLRPTYKMKRNPIQ